MHLYANSRRSVARLPAFFGDGGNAFRCYSQSTTLHDVCGRREISALHCNGSLSALGQRRRRRLLKYLKTSVSSVTVN